VEFHQNQKRKSPKRKNLFLKMKTARKMKTNLSNQK